MNYTLTRSQLEAKRAELLNQGVQLVGDNGKFTAKGVTILFTYSEPDLTVNVLDSGSFPKFLVNHKINGWFKA